MATEWRRGRVPTAPPLSGLGRPSGPWPPDGNDEPEPADGKIMFRKPAKRSSEKCLDFNVSSSKKMKEAKKTKREATTSQGTAKQVKNSSLLSFDDEENDD
ncbi:hypothetical protein TURU_035507 [Turdus rufiventris]|nr:hypothetical protein TURU_035507 [Turdus rufiventris]